MGERTLFDMMNDLYSSSIWVQGVENRASSCHRIEMLLKFGEGHSQKEGVLSTEYGGGGVLDD